MALPCVHAQKEPGPHGAASLPVPALRAESELVLIPASVVDRDGRFVSGLDASGFEVFDGRRRVEIDSFSVEDTPLSVVILLDASKSMKGEIDPAREGLRRFLRTSMPGDEFCLIPFDGQPRKRCEFTEDAGEIEREASLVEPAGETGLIDALMLALHESRRGRNSRKAVLVLSDGVDTASRHVWKEARLLAGETLAAVFAVTPAPRTSEQIREAGFLEEFAGITGGALHRMSPDGGLPDAFDELPVRKHYLIGFRPPLAIRDGKYHKVRVRLRESGPERLRVHWRRGYYSTAFHY